MFRDKDTNGELSGLIGSGLSSVPFCHPRWRCYCYAGVCRAGFGTLWNEACFQIKEEQMTESPFWLQKAISVIKRLGDVMAA